MLFALALVLTAMGDFATGDVPMQPKGSAAGMPPGKQMQSEESLPALDDEERKAVQMRARDRLNARGSGAKTPTSTRSPGAKTPKSSNRLPGYMTPKTGGTARSSRGAKSSRSSALTNRTSSPTGRYHPDVDRRLDIRKVCRAPPPPRRHRSLRPLCDARLARPASPSDWACCFFPRPFSTMEGRVLAGVVRAF